ncbi:hypothetical protein ACLKA6_018413 [Drosophila palustris]
MSIENVYRVCQHQKKLRSREGDRWSASGTGDRGPKINGNFMLSLRKNQHGPKSARTKHKVNVAINDLN